MLLSVLNISDRTINWMTLRVEPVAHVGTHKLGSRFPSSAHRMKDVIPCKSHTLGVAHHTASFAIDKFRRLWQLCALDNHY
jgi:hypothetical protein